MKVRARHFEKLFGEQRKNNRRAKGLNVSTNVVETFESGWEVLTPGVGKARFNPRPMKTTWRRNLELAEWFMASFCFVFSFRDV